MKKIVNKALSILMALTLIFGASTYEGAHTHVQAEETHVHTESTVVYGDGCAYDTVSGHYYVAVDESVEYNEAKSEAEDAGGYLACISSAEENDLVFNVALDANLRDTVIWIGYRRSAEDEEVWEWIDGSTSTYTNWNEGEPNNIDETVAEMYVDGGDDNGYWNDGYSDNYYCYVIEYDECQHPVSEHVFKNRDFTNCTVGGYTGDIHCGLCDLKLEDGVMAEAGEHVEEVLDYRTVVEETCTEEGYTGDYICPICETVLTEGSIVPEAGHTPEEELSDVYLANCYLPGNTGNTRCDVCDEIITAGTELEKLTHEYENDVCINCGRVKNATLNTAYTLETTENLPYVMVEFTPSKTGTYIFNVDDISEYGYDGYGYIFDNANTAEKQIIRGMNNIKNGNVDTDSVRLKNHIAYNDSSSDVGDMPRIEIELYADTTYYFVLGGYNGDDFGLGELTINCAHQETEVRGKTLTNCEEGGYTGDTYCLTCEELLQEGQQIEASNHTEGLVNEKTADCYSDGYTGDVVCDVCDVIIEEGQTIEKYAHEYENDICNYCGKIQNAVINQWYYTETTENRMYQVIEFIVPNDGYYNFDVYMDFYGTFYIYEKSDELDSKIAEAIMICNSGEDIPYLSDYYYKEDLYEDEYIRDIQLKKDIDYCIVIGPDGYPEDYGYIEIYAECTHYDVNIENKTITSCATGGYTGDVICSVCDEMLEEGVEVEPNSDHVYFKETIKDATCKTYAEVKYTCIYCDYDYTEIDTESGYAACDLVTEGYIEPTCTTSGNTGDRICKDCGYIESEGVEIPAYHDQTDEDGNNPYFYYGYQYINGTCTVDGYSGDTICRICREKVENGEIYPALGHDYEDGVCNVCGLDEDFLTKDEEGYYLIYTTEDLVDFIVNADTGINGRLMEDIIFPDNYVNDDWYDESAYSMVLDGNGHTIENFNIYGSYYPLFTYFDNSTVKDLTVVCNVECHLYDYFGTIAQYAYGSTFDNCIVNGNITSTNEAYCIGGFVGEAYECLFKDSTNNANITSKGECIGGFVGYGDFNKYINCVNNGDISTGDQQAGGITGAAYADLFRDCINNGDVIYTGMSDSGDEIGGIAGVAYDGAIFDGCENNGFVGNEDSDVYVDEVGGIVGQMFDYGTITNCTNNGNVTAGGQYIGGIVGDIDYIYLDDYSDVDVQISNCVNNGDVYGADCAGGIAGYAAYTTISNCANNGNITGKYSVAGISGFAEYCTIDKVFNTGTVAGRDEENTAGLVHGVEYDTVITNSEANHVHSYGVSTVVTSATLVANGKAIGNCICGKTSEIIIPAIGNAMFSKLTYDYTGKAIDLPTVTVMDKANKIISAEFYTVTYVDAAGKVVTSIVEAGTYTVKITFKGAYSGEITKSITVNKAAENPIDTPTEITKPAKVKITSAKNIKAKKIKLAWKKVKDANGYVIKYATNKKFKKAKTKTVKENKVKYTLKKLSKKKYFIKIRAYKVVNGKKYKGKWSNVKKVKVVK